MTNTTDRPDEVLELPNAPGVWERDGVLWFIDFGKVVYDFDPEPFYLLGGRYVDDGKCQYCNNIHLPRCGWIKAVPASPCHHCADKQAACETYSLEMAKLADRVVFLEEASGMAPEMALALIKDQNAEITALKARLAEVEHCCESHKVAKESAEQRATNAESRVRELETQVTEADQMRGEALTTLSIMQQDLERLLDSRPISPDPPQVIEKWPVDRFR